MKTLKQLFVVAGILCSTMVTLRAQDKSTKSPSALINEDEAGIRRVESNGTFKRSSSGLLYHVSGNNKTGIVKPINSKKVKVKYSLDTFDGAMRGTANAINIKEPTEIEMDKLPLGIQEAIKLMPVGSKCYVCMPAKLCKNKNGKTISGGRALVGSVEFISVLK